MMKLVFLRGEGFDFDVCYSSYLKRAIDTLNLALAEMDREWLPVEKSWKLNERHYSALQDLNKAKTAAKYGEEQVLVWRRSFDVRGKHYLGDAAAIAAKEQTVAQQGTVGK